jgi:hypothetical protein
MNERTTPVDIAMATLDHRRRFLWDGEYSQHIQGIEEAQKLIDLRRQQKKQH